MDDCDLRSLKVKPGELSPVFKPTVNEYRVTVGSKVNAITISCETSDRGASASILVRIHRLQVNSSHSELGRCRRSSPAGLISNEV